MQTKLVVVLMLISSYALSQGQSCVNELASAPYCYTMATAELICKNSTEMVQDMKDCVRENLELYGRTTDKRVFISSMCLIGSAISSDESKNISLCKDSHFGTNQQTSQSNSKAGAQ